MKMLERKAGQEKLRPIVEPIEKSESVSLDPIKPKCVTIVSSQLPEHEKRKLINFLKEHKDVFA